MNTDIGRTLNKNVINIIVNSIVAVLIALTSAFFILIFFWDKYFQVTHTTIEFAFIYIELAAFSIIWSTFDRNSTINQIIGFGFLTVGIFDVIHLYFYLFLPYSSTAALQLAYYYSTAGRVVKAFLLLAVSLEVFKIRTDRRKCALLSLGFALIISVGIYYSLEIWSFLGTKHILPTLKLVLEYSLLGVYVLCLVKLKDRISDRGIITYKYIFAAVLIAIPEELTFLMGGPSAGISSAVGHFLKLISSYLLYKGLFISAVTYSYEKLEENREHTESILNALPIGIITYDGEQKVNFANNRTAELLGCSREFVCGFSPSDIMRCFPGIGSTPEGTYNMNDVLSGKLKGISCVGTFVNFNGTETVLSISTQKLSSGMLVTLKDVRKELELENIELQTQTVLNAINQAVLVVDRDCRVVMFNKAFEDIFEIYERDMIRGRKVTDMLELVSDYGYNEAVKEIWEKSYISFDTYIITRNRKRKELLTNIAQINNVEGELLGWVGAATDVTDRKLEQLNIQQREKLALLGQMAAGIVHEIKNPLATIKGFNQIIKSKLQDDKLVKYAQTVESAINDVSKVANDFLSFAKPRPTVVRELSLNELLSSMQLMISSHAYTKSIKTCFDLCEKEMHVVADEGQIKQVILNLCENAIDALYGAEEPMLTVSTQLDELSREMLIRISDNGKGIVPEDLAKLGTPFFTTKEKGTGLGVSICYQIISRHNGKVQVKSTPDVGTSFTVILPCKG